MKNLPIAEEDISAYAEKYNTHPAIIIGRLQHLRQMPYSLGRKIIQAVELDC